MYACNWHTVIGLEYARILYIMTSGLTFYLLNQVTSKNLTDNLGPWIFSDLMSHSQAYKVFFRLCMVASKSVRKSENYILLSI